MNNAEDAGDAEEDICEYHSSESSASSALLDGFYRLY